MALFLGVEIFKRYVFFFNYYGMAFTLKWFSRYIEMLSFKVTLQWHYVILTDYSILLNVFYT